MNTCNLPILYNENLFNLNNNFHINICEEDWGTYLCIDNFWQYPEEINEYAMLIPTTKLSGIYDIEDNGKDFYDGRSHFVLPKKLLFHHVLEDIVKKFFNILPKPMDEDTLSSSILANNIFSMTEQCFENHKNCFYSPHNDGPDVIACLSYFNQEYDEEDGTAIFPRIGLTKIQSPWMSEVKPIGFLKAKYNRIIIYDGSIPHASTISKRWITEIRHSMVYFMKVYK